MKDNLFNEVVLWRLCDDLVNLYFKLKMAITRNILYPDLFSVVLVLHSYFYPCLKVFCITVRNYTHELTQTCFNLF